MRKILLAALVGLALVGFGGVAYAQEEDPTTPSSETSAPATETSTSSPTSEAPAEPAPQEEEEPPAAEDPKPEDPEPVSPEVTTATACGEGIGFVDVNVTNPNDTEVTYKVDLSKAGASVQTQSVTVGAGETGSVTFENVPSGDFDVLVTGDDGAEVTSAASVDRCDEITEPIDDPLQVFVRCENGEGLVTIRVFNLEGEAKTYTVSIDDVESGETIELGEGMYEVFIDEAPAPDGTFTVKVTAPGVESSETVNVACAPAPPTTTPPAQGRPAPADDELASTGAAVGGMALLGVLALGLGGGLVVASRRRRTAQSDGTES